MDLFDLLNMIGGLSLFLFGMNLMGQALERRAGNSLRSVLGKMTSGRLAGFLTGCGVTAVIQSSSATTVMVVGFVNSGLMTLHQAINVIMGANVGTTVTGWILSLSGISGSSIWVQLLKPSSFTPVLALIGIILYMFYKSSSKKDTGMILLGFATLMFGMETMSGAASGLAEVEGFRRLFLLFQNPFLGMLAGAVLTAVIQSSSASVGILQVLAATGQVSYGAAVPIIMGQNIGTCVTALISAVGTTKNAKRAAFVHLSFNVIGSVVLLLLFELGKILFAPALLGEAASRFGIAVVHTLFNLACVVILMPMASVLEKMAIKLLPDAAAPEQETVLDERLLATPPLALEQCRNTTVEMAQAAVRALKNSLKAVNEYSPALAEEVRRDESRTDSYEDLLATYLVKLSSHKMSDAGSAEATGLLKIIGDFERIGDHAVNILRSAEELQGKDLHFSEQATAEFGVLSQAVQDILDLTAGAFTQGSAVAAAEVEPLEQVVDRLREELRNRHIRRMQQGACSVELGFIWSDLLTDLERTSDHCSNIAGCIIDSDLNLHEALRQTRNDSADFNRKMRAYAEKYTLAD